MTMLRLVTVGVWALLFVLGGWLFWSSGQVQALESRNAALKQEIGRMQDRREVLRAEWHYLNNPAYLERMAQLHLKREKDTGGERVAEKPAIMTTASALPQNNIPPPPSVKPVVPEHFSGHDAGVLKAASAPLPSENEKRPASSGGSEELFNTLLASLEENR